jgi:hypothetical protein
MNSEAQTTLNTLLILVVALLQFLLRTGSQKGAVKELEQRLEEAEERLEEIQRRLLNQG